MPEIIEYSDTVAQIHCIISLIIAIVFGIWHYMTRPLYGFWSWEGWSFIIGACIWFLVMVIGFEIVGSPEEAE